MMMNMKSLQSLLDTLLADQDNWKVQLLKHWPTIMGSLSTKVHLEKIAEDHLVLAVSDSCWLQELYLMSGMLRQAINKKLDRPRIKTLRFKIVAKTSPQRAATTPPKKRNYHPIALTAAEQASLTCIQDEALKKALADFLQRCKQE
jgi:hypothetical protein